MTTSRPVIISNRLPFQVAQDSKGRPVLRRTTGGLGSALHTLLSRTGGEWIGWDGSSEGGKQAGTAALFRNQAYRVVPLRLTPEEVRQFYDGFSNRTLWPLFHDFPGRTAFDAQTWEGYQRVNARFARAAVRHLRPSDRVWVHDYHLLLLARHLREKRPRAAIGLFNHIPFPHWDLFRKLPWRAPILEAMLAYDLVGFQTPRDMHNFIGCVLEAFPDAALTGARADRAVLVPDPSRRCRLGAFPIGIDFAAYDALARDPKIQRRAVELRALYPGRRILLGVDRLDYSKGIPLRLKAFEAFLERHPRFRGKVTYIQIAAPSRVDVKEYKELRREIDRLVGRINGRFTQAGWVPIHYLYRSLPSGELAAFYHMSDAALVTPLKDGMNLICQEYCAASYDGRGVLILSEFAGASEVLGWGPIRVNPYDILGVADAIARALAMPRREEEQRLAALRETIRERNVGRWAEGFLEELDAAVESHRPGAGRRATAAAPISAARGFRITRTGMRVR